MKKLLIGFAALMILAGFTMALQEAPDTITLTAKNGNVTFGHKAHQDLGYKCKECHHTVANDMDTPDKKCHDCHTADSAVKSMKAFHNNCKDCHTEYVKANADSKAPTKCKECHVE